MFDQVLSGGTAGSSYAAEDGLPYLPITAPSLYTNLASAFLWLHFLCCQMTLKCCPKMSMHRPDCTILKRMKSKKILVLEVKTLKIKVNKAYGALNFLLYLNYLMRLRHLKRCKSLNFIRNPFSITRTKHLFANSEHLFLQIWRRSLQ